MRTVGSTTYKAGETLGRGAFGEVVVARKSGSQEKLAMKIIDLENKHGVRSTARLAKIQNEVMLLSRVKGHSNCVEYVDLVYDNVRCYLLMELCTMSLLQALDMKPSVVDGNFVHISRQMLSAISHCHSQRVVHRDVKLDNLMFGGPEGNTLKLCDFHLAREIPEGYLQGVAGSTPYMAPEVVARLPYNELVDVWSAGVVAYVLSLRHFPYSPKENCDNTTETAIRTGSPSPRFPSDERGSFLRKLMERSGKERCSASDALVSEFLDSRSTVCDFQRQSLSL
eukprot:TRINITY_DN19536_c0_g2_i3.p1 TRINITY_DN19536_c0_g2~~TRINITY_DN19536_c0_g2_i3.p1  ORF type:complete len:309 (-),score=27.64 TRINITY_DN19536_c0_g2_i3:301-1146(-)